MIGQSAVESIAVDGVIVGRIAVGRTALSAVGDSRWRAALGFIE
jgi:hypothetical protein